MVQTNNAKYGITEFGCLSVFENLQLGEVHAHAHSPWHEYTTIDLVDYHLLRLLLS
jgi:hypothetical protein